VQSFLALSGSLEPANSFEKPMVFSRKPSPVSLVLHVYRESSPTE